MKEISLGDVTVTRVEEVYGPVGMAPRTFFPDSSDEDWARHEEWLAPHFLDPDTQIVQSAIQTWVLRSEGKVILVDTGVGNHKERPYAPVWGHLNTDFIRNLSLAGVEPEDVDIVINTHLHIDHVGWNTYLHDREWIPTFPNAQYLMPKRDFDFWNPLNNHKPLLGRGNQNVFEDSVAPVHRAGQTVLWDDSYDIDANLRLTLAPGHTPGSSVLALNSGDDRAVFVGDLLHNPIQIVLPEANSCFCEDPAEARSTRRRILGESSENNALVFPAHLGGSGAFTVQRENTNFAVKQWAPFSSPSKSL